MPARLPHYDTNQVMKNRKFFLIGLIQFWVQATTRVFYIRVNIQKHHVTKQKPIRWISSKQSVNKEM